MNIYVVWVDNGEGDEDGPVFAPDGNTFFINNREDALNHCAHMQRQFPAYKYHVYKLEEVV